LGDEERRRKIGCDPGKKLRRAIRENESKRGAMVGKHTGAREST
jgi:hypothetical protein